MFLKTDHASENCLFCLTVLAIIPFRAESLEHFHLFRRSGPTTAPSEATLEMHSDMGLFIVMTAADYFDLPSGERMVPPDDDTYDTVDARRRAPESGFRLRLPDGSVVRPTIPSGSILVMNGEGSRLWMKTSASLKTPTRWPYVPAHEVLVPNMDQNIGRAWFGRMYLPLRDAVLQREQPSMRLAGGIKEDSAVTFGWYRDQTFAAFSQGKPHLASTIGCGPSYGDATSSSASSKSRALIDNGSCNSNQVYCW